MVKKTVTITQLKTKIYIYICETIKKVALVFLKWGKNYSKKMYVLGHYARKYKQRLNTMGYKKEIKINGENKDIKSKEKLQRHNLNKYHNETTKRPQNNTQQIQI